MQKRTLRAQSGLAAAMLSVALVAGCTPAHFLPGGNPAAGNTPPVSQGQGQTATFNVHPDFGGLAVQSLGVRVTDAVTGAPLRVVSIGGASVVAAGAGNYVALQVTAGDAGNGFTSLPVDSAGGASAAFEIQVAQNAGGSGQYNIAVQGYASPTSGYTLSGTNGNSVTVEANVSDSDKEVAANAASTAVAEIEHSLFLMAAALSPDLQRTVIANIKSEMATVQSNLVTYYSNPDHIAEAKSLVQSIDPKSGMLPQSAISALNTSLSAAGVSSNIDSAVTSTFTTISDNKSSLVNSVDTSGLQLIGSSLTLNHDQNDPGLTLTKSDGTKIAIDLSNPVSTSGNQPGTGQPFNPPNLVTTGNTGDLQATTNSSDFKPTVVATATSNVLQTSVIQTTEKIGRIWARIPISSSAGTTTVSGALPTTIGTGTTKGNNQNASLTVDGTAGANSPTAVTPWTTLTASQSLWSGHIKTTGGTTMATFDIYKDSSYYYLLTVYSVQNAILVSDGISTQLNTAAGVFTSLNSGTKVDYVMAGTEGDEASSTVTLK
ncbi:MAG TPA: hypothetical protein V6D47_10225 [Oscillatoriaceae cyanobacterium]